MRGKPAETREGKSAARTRLGPWGAKIEIYLVRPQDNCDCLPRTVWLYRLQSGHQIAVCCCGVRCGDAGACQRWWENDFASKTISPPESSI